MHSFFEIREMLQLVIEYIGFSPGRYCLKECSRYFHREISGVVHLARNEFIEALNRELVNPKYLKLQDCTLSDSLLEYLDKRTLYPRRLKMDYFFEDRPLDEFMTLGNKSLQMILRSSILSMNVSIFDIAIESIEARGYDNPLVIDFLRNSEFQSSLMKADALEFLERMVGKVQLSDSSLLASLLVCATKFRARKCESYLQRFMSDSKELYGMLEAHAYAGDLQNVRILCRTASPENIRNALKEAVGKLHLEVAKFLRAEWESRASPSYSDRVTLLIDLLSGLPVKGKVEPSVELLTCLFEGIENLDELRIDGLTLLQFACRNRYRTMCHFLVNQGCISFSIWYPHVELGKDDLLYLLDLCCGLKKGTSCKKDHRVEMFLLKKGLHLRKYSSDSNPIIPILRDGYRNASLADRIELIQYYLRMDPEWATKFGRCDPWDCSIYFFTLTPPGVLELFGTPETRLWTGKNVCRLADFIPFDKDSPIDEWTRGRPNEIEIQAVREIRTVLIQHGAHPGVLFRNAALELSLKGVHGISVEFYKRTLEGRADVNHRGRYGLTPLSWVLSGWMDKRLEVADVLFEYGADINATDNLGRTAIFRAIANLDDTAFDWLIGKGADLTIRDKYNVRPIDIARYLSREYNSALLMVRKINKICGLTDIRNIDVSRSISDMSWYNRSSYDDTKDIDEYWSKLEI